MRTHTRHKEFRLQMAPEYSMGGNSKSSNKSQVWDFPGGPVVKSSTSSAGNVGYDLWPGN